MQHPEAVLLLRATPVDSQGPSEQEVYTWAGQEAGSQD